MRRSRIWNPYNTSNTYRSSYLPSYFSSPRNSRLSTVNVKSKKGRCWPLLCGIFTVIALFAFIVLLIFYIFKPSAIGLSRSSNNDGEPDWRNLNLLEQPLSFTDDAYTSVSIKQKAVEVKGTKIAYYEALPTSKKNSDKTIILLHPEHSNAEVWIKQTQTVQTMAAAGFHVLALDLPGFGKSPGPVPNAAAKGPIITSFIEKVVPLSFHHTNPAIVVAPSMAGQYAVPATMHQSEKQQAKICGLVTIAPIGTEDFQPKQYKKVKVPTMIVVGENDKSVGPRSTKSLKLISTSTTPQQIPFASHLAFIDNSERFNLLLFNFVEHLYC